MKITFQRNDFLSAFQTAAIVVGPKGGAKPILAHVKMVSDGQKTQLMGTDLDVGILIEVPDIEVDTPGQAILTTDRFGSILRESSDEKLTLQIEGDMMQVVGDRSQFNLPCFPPEDYPSLGDIAFEQYHEIPATLMRELIRRTVYSTDEEGGRYALGGVLLEMTEDRIYAVGTDGRRLAKMEGPASAVGGHSTEGKMVIVPTRHVRLIDRAIGDGESSVQLCARGNDLQLRCGGLSMFTRLIEGRFPRWRDVLPRRPEANRITMTAGPLEAAVRQASIFCSEESSGIDFVMQNGVLTLEVSTSNIGRSHIEMPVAYDGSITFSLQHAFVSAFLRTLSPEKTFMIEFQDSAGAVLFLTDDGYEYVIMPMSRQSRRP